MGAHPTVEEGMPGVRFTVWAPRAQSVSVAGDFNGWDAEEYPLEKRTEGGLWTGFLPGVEEGAVYKYVIVTPDGERLFKADPYGFYAELRPATASVVHRLGAYLWGDGAWERTKKRRTSYKRPMAIYEVHLGSWRTKEDGSFYTYEELADTLVPYVKEQGFTHIELLPVNEHPFDRSWGYQITGYYAVTSRYGTPDQFKLLVDRCHQEGIGVILDWVPGHFCKDAQGLRLFDGTPAYEYADSRKAEKPQWGTLTFDYSKGEVRSFLISNALFWMNEYHIDGLRVDAVASMMELNFDKPASMWTLNAEGGTDNLEALSFLRELNRTVFHYYPQALMIAEDSSDRPLITGPVHEGGLGFNYKWNMGWMNDMLRYMALPVEERRHRHNLITFSLMYAFSENYVLPLSHDEVVHGKKSLLDKMPGDYWSKFANLRLFYGYWMTHPGKKLLFMGGELGMFSEWKDLEQVDWHLLEFEKHQQMHDYVRGLNRLYAEEPALWELDHEPAGFEWIDADNAEQGIVSFIRRGKRRADDLCIVCNFTPAVYHGYRIGVPASGDWREVWNSDWPQYGGSGQYNGAPVTAGKKPFHGKPYSTEVTIPPFGCFILKREAAKRRKAEQAVRQKAERSSIKPKAASVSRRTTARNAKQPTL